jgi:hypothetical protein
MLLYAFALPQFDKEAINIKSPVSSVSMVGESVRPNCTLVAPAPQGAGMDVKNASYFVNSQKRCYFVESMAICHSIILIYLKVYHVIKIVLPFIRF